MILALQPAYRYGMGQTVGGQGVGPISLTLGTPLLSGGAIVGASALSTAGITAASWATAGITAGVGLIAAGIMLWLGRAGPKQNVASTAIVNEAEPLLQQNLAAWQASQKTCADLVQCMANFQNVWNAVVAACAVSALGDPGHSCLDDRLPQGVTFNTGAPANFNIMGNGTWNWFDYYLAPILNDPAAQACCPLPSACYDPACTAPVPLPACTAPPPPVGSAGSNGSNPLGVIASSLASSTSGINWPALLVPAALVLVIYLVNQ